MSFLDLVNKRVSIRVYETRPVPEKLLMTVIEAGRLAPSAANRQPVCFILVRDEGQRAAIGDAYPHDWFRKAPAIIVVCVETGRAWKRADGKVYGDVDGAIAMDHMTLCAADLGLGTCWVAAFDPAKLREVLQLPAGVDPLAMMPVGYPAEGGRAKSRKAVEQLVRLERWS